MNIHDLTERPPEWWPPAAVACLQDLLSYRLVGASACADRITTALVDVASAADRKGLAVAVEIAVAGSAFTRLKPDTGLYVNLVDILTATAQSGSARDVAACAADLDAYRSRAQATVVATTAELLQDAGIILIHDYSSVVLRILAKLAQNRPRTIVVTTGEPLGQGRRVAESAAAAGHRVIYTPDMAVGRLVDQLDAFLTGVETFYPDGSMANTVGTLMLGLLCRDRGKPVFGPAELLKYGCQYTTADPTQLTARLLPGRTSHHLPDAARWTIEDHVLDAVPSALIAGYVTDDGRTHPAEIGAKAAQLLARWMNQTTGSQ